MKTIIIIITLTLSILSLQKLYSQENSNKSNILFHDLQPDVVLMNALTDSFIIDINEDLINDVILYLEHTSSGNWALIKSLNQNCQYSLINYYLNDSLSIKSINWHSEAFIFLGEQKYNNIEKIGIKIISKDLNYYGWIKVIFSIINMNIAITIDKYAFCTIPNYPLLWGQTEIVTGTSDLKEDSDIKVYTTDSGNQLVVQSGEVIKSIRVIDLLGATVVVKDNIRDKQATLSTKGLVHGTYIVKITNSNLKEYTSKIVF